MEPDTVLDPQNVPDHAAAGVVVIEQKEENSTPNDEKQTVMAPMNDADASKPYPQLDDLTPTPVKITQQKELEYRNQAIHYKKLSLELQKNFYDLPHYYLLSVRWLNRWKVFVSYDQATSDAPSSKYIGAGELPAVNVDILDHEARFDINLPEEYSYLENALRPGLKVDIDYIIISPQMWEVFYGEYKHYSFKRFLNNTSDGKKVQVYFHRVNAILLYNQILREIQREYLKKFKRLSIQLPQYTPISEQFIKFITKQTGYLVKKAGSFYKFSDDPLKCWAITQDMTQKQLMNYLTKACKTNNSYSYKICIPGELIELEKEPLSKYQLPHKTHLIFQLRQQNDEWELYSKQHMPQLAKCDHCRIAKKLIVQCSCNQAVYCSAECKTRDKSSHRYKCDRDAESSEDEKKLEMTVKSKRGIMGLRNLGNTCFMNSGIQCITSVDLLTHYFLNKQYLPDINRQNPIGTKGELSEAYAKQIQKMWYGQEDSVAPTVLKRAIGKFQPMFVGFQQHDSDQLISYLLDGLHQDLNRVKIKPYTQSKDYDGRQDHIVAKQSWQLFLMRNKSVIVDLMYGQYKSRLQCPNCKKISVTFDPFLLCNIPIPQNQNQTKIFQVKYLKDHIKCSKMQITINKAQNLKLSDVSNMIAEFLEVSNKMIVVGVSYYDSKLLKMTEDANEIRKEYKHKNVFFRQLYEGENLETDVPVNTILTLCHSLYGNENYRRNIIKPRIYLFDPSTTAKQVHQRFFKYFGQLLGVEDYEKDIVEKQPQDRRWHILLVTKSSYELCQYCEKNACYNCHLPYTDQITIKDLMEKAARFKDTHKLEFEIYWRKNAQQVEKTFEKNEVDLKFPTKVTQKQKSGVITIYDCLKLAKQPETLQQQNAWYCPNCKDFVLATKQMAIYKAPKILIVTFKRFKSKGHYKQKLTTFVDFPIENLDISQYVINPQLPSDYFKEDGQHAKPSTKYTLFAISNHFGGLGGGHYTAFCRKEGSRWYEFDDSSVTPISEDRLVEASAYVLFYRRND